MNDEKNNSGREGFILHPSSFIFLVLCLLTFRASAQLTVDVVITNGLFEPYGVAADDDNIIYIGDSANHRIVRHEPNTGVSTTIAGLTGETGSNDGPFYLAHFNSPQGVVLAKIAGVSGLVVADTGNHLIRFVNLTNGSVSTLAGAAGLTGNTDAPLGTNARFRYPVGLALDAAGVLYIADTKNSAIRQINLADPNFGVTTLAVSGTTFREPNDVAVLSTNQLWIADTRNHTVKLVTRTGPTNASLTLLMGSDDQNIPGSTDSQFGGSARFNNPRGLLYLGKAGLVIADTANQTIRLATNNPVIGAPNNYAVLTLAGIAGQSGFVNGAALSAKFSGPHGLARDALGNGFLIADTANSAIRRLQNGLPQPPVATPQIGWVDFPPLDYLSVLRTDQPFVFNNDIIIAILAEQGTETFFTFGPTPPSPVEDTIPNPSRLVGATPPPYRNGLFRSQVAPTIIPPQPDVTVKAIGTQDGRRSSAISAARFQFKVANPIVNGDNAASFLFYTTTSNAVMWYTTDGGDPTNAGPSISTVSSSASLSLRITNDTLTFKVRAFRDGYKPSDIVSKIFYATNFVPNRISFGFQSGEASSEFIAAPGQIFYAPVTLSVLPGAAMYSLQFNVTVSGLTGPPITAVPAPVQFTSMLQEAVPPAEGNRLPPGAQQWFRQIPTAMFVGYNTNFVGTNVFFREVFEDMRFTNSIASGNSILLGVGWLERWGQNHLYATTLQDLIRYSIARDTLFNKGNGRVILGAYGFQVPPSASFGQTYQIRLDRPSATTDGVGAPGSDIYIETPTDGTVSALKVVTLGQRKYIAGDAAPFRWLNAGDFGNTNLLNDDVMQVFETVIYQTPIDELESKDPPEGSDLFDAMDSCCGTAGLTNGGVYYRQGGTVVTNNYLALIYGNDTTINSYPFGDGVLDVSDIYVTFRRSLDCSLTWWQRFHTTNGLAAEIVPNQYRGNTNCEITPGPGPSIGAAPAVAPEIRFSASDGIAGAGQTVSVPITAQVRGDFPLRVVALSLELEPLDGSPAVATPVEFTPSAALGAPTISQAHGPAGYNAAWLDSGIVGLSGDSQLGALRITLPADAPPNAAYALRFHHASGSPNGLASFPKHTSTGLITASDRSASSFNDGIPDSWRLRYFGTVNNILSQASADADGDGATNLQEYKAGTDPNDAASVLRVKSRAGQPRECVVRWPSVSGKQYVVEHAASIYAPSWTPISTNAGTGWEMEYRDISAGTAPRFFRVRVLE